MMIDIEITVNAPIQKVWDCWTQPKHITQWNFASDEWCCPKANNELVEGSKFSWRMEAKDGSMGFDFIGTYTDIQPIKSIKYSIEDGRSVIISFEEVNGGVRVQESFEAEGTNSDEMQRAGWQAILINFKKHVESL